MRTKLLTILLALCCGAALALTPPPSPKKKKPQNTNVSTATPSGGKTTGGKTNGGKTGGGKTNGGGKAGGRKTQPQAQTHTQSQPQKQPQSIPSASASPLASLTADDRRAVEGIYNNMVYVDGGTFYMGATSEQVSDAYSDEKPVHRVTLTDFRIGRYEVTQREWQAVMGSNPSYFTGDLDRPVERVSYEDCLAFIRKLNTLTGKSYRLPTEAEWEFAARGGTRSQSYKYSGSNSLADVAWYEANSSSTTHRVGTKSPNELGLYDMSGNVWEWCADRYGSYPSYDQTNPAGSASGSRRVSRGGSWHDGARFCRVSYRRSFEPSYRFSRLGLRLAL